MNLPLMQDLINENFVAFADVVPNGWAIVPKNAGFKVGFYFPEDLGLWRSADFVGSYDDMVGYAILHACRNHFKSNLLWLYCLAECGASYDDTLLLCWMPVEWKHDLVLTDEAYEKFFYSRTWTPQSESEDNSVYSNPLRRKWVRVGLGREDNMVTHEPRMKTNVVPLTVSRPMPPAVQIANEKRCDDWGNAMSAALQL